MPAAPPELTSTRGVRAAQRLRALSARVAAQIEVGVDRVSWGWRKRFGRLGALQIVSYRGYGTREQVVVRGRVLEAEEQRLPSPDDSPLTNLRHMIRRFNSQEVPDTEVRVTLGVSTIDGRSDDEGYFNLLVWSPRLTESQDDWHKGNVEVVGCPVPGWTAARADAEVLIPGPRAEFGIISDIDDTVLQTHVTKRWKMLWVTLMGNAYTRLPFEGTTELYRALSVGASGRARNPVFYISKSPWNLYDFLIAFMERHELPRGPLFLRDIGLRNKGSLDFKTQTIEQILETYRDLSFVLIGDSGERDPDVYLDIAARYPGRVRAIYIREVNWNPLRRLELQAMPEQARRLGCEMLLVSHAHEALEHARWLGIALGPA